MYYRRVSRFNLFVFTPTCALPIMNFVYEYGTDSITNIILEIIGTNSL